MEFTDDKFDIMIKLELKFEFKFKLESFNEPQSESYVEF